MVIHLMRAFLCDFCLCSNWQEFTWHSVSHSPSAIAELLVYKTWCINTFNIFCYCVLFQSCMCVCVCVWIMCEFQSSSCRNNLRGVDDIALANIAEVYQGKHASVFICPIAIAYSMGQIIKSFCVCACVCVCPSVDTLTVAFLRRFSPNWTQTCKPPKVRTSFLGSISPHPFSYFLFKNPHFWPRGPENPCKNEKRNICLKCSRITNIPTFYRKSG